MLRIGLVCFTTGILLASSINVFAQQQEQQLPAAKPIGQLEKVATFDGPMPTGVTISHSARIFVNFPRWGDQVDFTVAELKDGKPIAFPNPDINRADQSKAGENLISVQSVVVDPKDRLWILDTGSIEFAPVVKDGAKLVGVDLNTNKVFKTITFPSDVALTSSYLNDVRFDLKRGKQGVAYITDSSQQGQNGIIVVDLESGKSWRRLDQHQSTLPEDKFLPIVEGRPLMSQPPGGTPSHMSMGSDGIAVSPDGSHLYYRPLSSRHLYRVSTEALADPTHDNELLTAEVDDLGDVGFASDGLECGSKGELYLTDYEDNAIMLRSPDGNLTTIACDPRLLWPDTLALSADGYLYVTANQLHRQARFHGGQDERQKPYVLFRIKVQDSPIALQK
jgi:sugar lactone lactonase YvrE